jgi:serine/threonine protein kinase
VSAEKPGGVGPSDTTGGIQGGDFVKELFRRSERYEVLDQIGQGGMGQVYKAIDRELDEVVALKLLKPRLSSDPAVIARFKQEIKLTRRIKHKNVARIFDLGEIGGYKFISMEYIDGQSLKDVVLSRGPMSLELTVHVFRQVLAGLAAAHDEGIVHRDIKPQNIMVTRDFTTFVLDFGIARSLESEDLFQVGVLVGSPAYMSTEQVLRKDIDHRSDVYSLGVLLFELLGGRPPFQARTLVAAANKHVTEPAPDVRTLRPDAPEWVARMILRCMEKQPKARYQTVAEMLADLTAHAAGDGAQPLDAAAPVAQPTPSPADSGPLGVPQETIPPGNDRPMALVAEDDPDIAKALREKLEALGVEVEQVPDGVAAVDRAVDGRFDLLLIGSDLPRLDGIEATRILKNYATTRDLPVIVLIPADNSTAQNFAYDSGAADVLTKPINLPALARKARQLLDL